MECDVLILGGGIAGCAAAVKLAEAGLDVTIVTKHIDRRESNTFYAQGGIVYTGPGDSPDLLERDIIKAGAGLSYPPAVRILTQEGPERVKKLVQREPRIPFDRHDDVLQLALEGAHSVRRIIHAEDTTGRAIIEGFQRWLTQGREVQVLSDCMAVDLITSHRHGDDLAAQYEADRCYGAFILPEGGSEIFRIRACYTLLAAGGCGRIFRHTSNPPLATGDGLAMAQRAGARLHNLEYTQFHPTTLAVSPAAGFLISEAVRGEGARLIDRAGHAVMEGVHPLLDLAPRDIVSRGIAARLSATGDPHVFLDMRGLSDEVLESRFPAIHAQLLASGLDPRTDPIPVVPAFHFMCGGVAADLRGRTSLNGLYAAGETACTGLHGANRLAGTSLMEGLVFGERAAESMLRSHKEALVSLDRPFKSVPHDLDLPPAPADLIHEDWEHLRGIMWNYVGVVRNDSGLRRAVEELSQLKKQIAQFYADNAASRGLLELRNGVDVGLAIAKAAAANRDSRGCHYRIHDHSATLA